MTVLSEFDFDLPNELIALRPAVPRSAARLLVCIGNRVDDSRVSDLPDQLRPGDRLVFNDTKVIPALLHGVRHRPGMAGSGVRVTVNLDSPAADGCWQVLARPSRRLRIGDILEFGDELTATVGERRGEFHLVDFQCGPVELEQALESTGNVPLPPYITSARQPDTMDKTDYQTVFACRPGAVAAPTASLHFDNELLERLDARGVRSTFVTLHVGAGTFLPIRAEAVEQHRMHSERGELSDRAAREINSTLADGARVIAVGTTALRLLETAAEGGMVKAWRGRTDLYIRPGYNFKIVSGLMTNFHLPRTTLLVLVAALVGRDRLCRIYQHALTNRYRFFSYGDSSLLIP